MTLILRIILSTFVLFFGLTGTSQNLSLVSPLVSSVHETSGLIMVDGKLITHNDSGGDPFLYEIDSLTGNVSRTVVVANAFNTDWEDITADNDFIYIGDFGNNSGSRTDLKLFRVAISDYLSTPNDTVYADTTFISYADQTDFTPSSFQTNYDAEALIAYGDSLYLFSKNWGNGKSYIYTIPKIPGTYSLVKKDSIDSQGQITGATYNAFNNSIMLTGYSGLNPFVLQISQFTGDGFANGHIVKQSITPPGGYSYQIESIICHKLDYYYLTAEDNFAGNAGLFSLEARFLSIDKSKDDIQLSLFPNPCHGQVNIQFNTSIEEQLQLDIFTLDGKMVQSHNIQTQANQKAVELNLQDLSGGSYMVRVHSENREAMVHLVVR